MKPKLNGNIQRTQTMNHSQGEGPNWVLIAGGALLSTLSIRFVCKVKQAFEAKHPNNADNAAKGNGKALAKRKPGACKLHTNIYCYRKDEDDCYHCLSGISDGAVDIKRSPTSPMSMDADLPLPLVKIPNKESNGVMWASSPDRLEPPPKPSHHSNSSDSPRASESGSDIFIKREVIQKLRHQLRRRDDMIIEMQSQITDLRNSLGVEASRTSHLESRLESTNRDLFDSEREIQRLRKAIADHCMMEAASPEKPVAVRNWRLDPMEGYTNNGGDEVELHCVGERGRGEGQRIEMLKREVEELKEVIEGKEILLQSYKEQKVELSSQVKNLQLKLVSQVPNIL